MSRMDPRVGRVALLLALVGLAAACAKRDPDAQRRPLAQGPTQALPLPSRSDATLAAPAPALHRVDVERPEPAPDSYAAWTGSGSPFALRISAAPLQEVLDVLSTRSRLPLFAEPGLELPVTLQLDQVTVDAALDALLSRYDLAAWIQGGRITVGRPPLGTTAFHMTMPDALLLAPLNAGEGGAAQQQGNTTQEADTWTALVATVQAVLSTRGLVQADPEASMLLVRDVPSRIDVVEKALEQAVAPRRRQVMIEALVLEVELSDDMEYGVDWQALDLDFDLGDSDIAGSFTTSLSPTSPVTTFGVASRRISSILSALRSRGNLEVLSAPRLTTMNRVPARIAVTEEIPFFTSDLAGIGNEVIQNIELEFREAGITLWVTPLIGAGREILLDIKPTITELTGFTPTIQNLPPNPILDTRELRALVRARDHESIVVAGLIRRRYSESSRGVPMLQDVPGLGTIFRDLDQQATRSELVVILTPILPDDADHRAAVEQALERTEALRREFRPGPVPQAQREEP